MSTQHKQCYVVNDASELPVHLRDRTPFTLSGAEMVLRFPRGEVFGSDGTVKMNGAIEFQAQISAAVLSEVCDPDEIYKSEMKSAHRFRCVYDPALQRGVKETPKGPREFLREPQVASMMKDIEGGTFDCPQLMWNLRAGDTVWAYLKEAKELRIYEGVATRPDTNHRHHAIVRFQRQYQQWVAQTGSETMGSYNPAREYGLVVYTDDFKGEAHRSFVYNALGWKVPASTAEYLESKTQAPNVHSKLARELMERASVLGHQNVEILTASVPKNSAKMISFGTLVQAMRAAFPRILESEYDAVLGHLVRFVEALAAARPREIAVLERSQRQRVRETSLADHPVLWSAYIRLASHTFAGGFPDWEQKIKRLSADAPGGDLLSLSNPIWVSCGVVGNGKGAPQVRNNPKARHAAFEALCEALGIGWGAPTPAPAGKKIPGLSNGEDTNFHERLAKGASPAAPPALERPPRPAAEKPAAPSEKPATASTKPAVVSEKPAAVSEKPAAVSEKPAAPPASVSPAARDFKEAFAESADSLHGRRAPGAASPLRPVPVGGGNHGQEEGSSRS